MQIPPTPRCGHHLCIRLLQDEISLKDLPVSFIVGTRYDHYKATSDGNEDVKKVNGHLKVPLASHQQSGQCYLRHIQKPSEPLL